MRSSRALIAITAAAGMTLFGVGVVSAQGGETAHRQLAASPTTVPDDEFAAIFEILEPDQLNCLMRNVGNLEDLDDFGAMFDLITECGVSIDQLFEIGEATTGQPAAPIDPVKPDGDDDVLAALGLGPTDLECIETGLSGTVPVADDTAALALLQDCDLSLVELLRGLVTLDAGVVVDDEEIAPTPVPTPPDELPDEAPGGIVDMFIEQMGEQGLNLDADQAQCLLDNISNLDFEDLSASLQVFQECGISISDLFG